MTKATEIGYLDTSTKLVIESLTNLLITLVKYVDLDAEKFDNVLRILGPMRNLSAEHKKVLEEVNGDAVWLAEFRETAGKLEVPVSRSERFVFAEV